MFKKIIAVAVCLAAAVTVIFSACGITDRSAVYSAEGLRWNGTFYKTCSGFYEEGKTIAKTTDGNFDINEIENDPEHNFVVVRSFTDDSLFVRSDYNVPDSGNPNTVYLGTNKIENTADKNILSDIFLNESETFSLTATHNDVNKWQSVSIGYSGCPVAIFRGYIGFADGNYFFTVDLSDMKAKDDESGTQFTVVCKTINKKYDSLLNAYFN